MIIYDEQGRDITLAVALDRKKVRAALIAALQDDAAYSHGPGDVFLLEPNELWVDGNRSMFMDKVVDRLIEGLSK